MLVNVHRCHIFLNNSNLSIVIYTYENLAHARAINRNIAVVPYIYIGRSKTIIKQSTRTFPLNNDNLSCVPSLYIFVNVDIVLVQQLLIHLLLDVLIGWPIVFDTEVYSM